MRHAAIPTLVVSPVENFLISWDERDKRSTARISSVMRGTRSSFDSPKVRPMKSR